MKNYYICYTSRTNNKTYYWYLKKNTSKVYCNGTNFTKPASATANLERIANIQVLSYTDDFLQIKVNNQNIIQAKANLFYNLLGE